MAAAFLSTQKKEDFKEEFLTCSICSEPYDNDKRKAKCLPCLHTYCKSCLQRIAGKRPKLDCPNCRKLVTLPGGTVDSLPHNFIVENLKEYQDIFSLSVSCGGCESLHAISFCHDCGLFQCQKCVDSHRHYGPLRNHKLSTMAELQRKKYNPATFHKQHCQKHSNQEIVMYCTDECCKVPVCAICSLDEHQGHKLIDLSAAIAKVIEEIQQSTERVNGRNQELTNKRKAIEQQQKTLTNNFKKKETEMQEMVDTMRNQIDASYNKAHSHMKNLYETEMSNLKTNLESIDTLASQMTSACEFANKSCDMSHPTQLLTSQNQIMERLNELDTTKLLQTDTSDKTDFDFTEVHNSAVAKVQQLHNELFGIIWIQRPVQARAIHAPQPQHLRQEVPSPPSFQLPPPSSQAQSPFPATNQHPQQLQLRYPMMQEDQFLPPAYQYQTEMGPTPVWAPAQVDPQQCTIQIALPRNSYDRNREAIIQTVDVTGQKMTTGGAKVEATQYGDPLDVQDNNDGTYTFVCNITYVPGYGQSDLYVKINGTEMTSSPFLPL